MELDVQVELEVNMQVEVSKCSGEVGWEGVSLAYMSIWGNQVGDSPTLG